MVDRLTNTFSSNMSYIGYGALGGYVGAYALARWNGVEGIQPLGRYQIESGVAGGVFNYIWLLALNNVDTDTVWKAMLVGFLGEWLYNRFVKGILTEMNVVS